MFSKFSGYTHSGCIIVSSDPGGDSEGVMGGWLERGQGHVKCSQVSDVSHVHPGLSVPPLPGAVSVGKLIQGLVPMLSRNKLYILYPLFVLIWQRMCECPPAIS